MYSVWEVFQRSLSRGTSPTSTLGHLFFSPTLTSRFRIVTTLRKDATMKKAKATTSLEPVAKVKKDAKTGLKPVAKGKEAVNHRARYQQQRQRNCYIGDLYKRHKWSYLKKPSTIFPFGNESPASKAVAKATTSHPYEILRVVWPKEFGLGSQPGRHMFPPDLPIYKGRWFRNLSVPSWYQQEALSRVKKSMKASSWTYTTLHRLT